MAKLETSKSFVGRYLQSADGAFLANVFVLSIEMASIRPKISGCIPIIPFKATWYSDSIWTKDLVKNTSKAS
jgi:hypothetical protein